MKFGIFDIGLWHESKSQNDVFVNLRERAILGDQLGYDSFWLGEHHFSRHGIVADTLLEAAAIASVTTRVRIGTAVVVLPFHNPVRVAEQAAMVDILSNGRLDLGVGVGYQHREFVGLNVSMDEARDRFHDSVEIILKCWLDETLIHESAFYTFTSDDDIQVYPKPVQAPHIPLYQAVSISPTSIESAAKRGLPVMVGGPTDTLGLAPQVIEYWRTKMIEHNNDPSGIDLPFAKGVYVAPSDEEALADVAEVDTLWTYKLLQAIGSPISPAGDVPKGFEYWENRVRKSDALDPNKAGTPPLIGSPETVAERLGMLKEMGINYIFGQFGLPGMEESKVRRSIELFSGIMGDFQDDSQTRNPDPSLRTSTSVSD
jgi:alkanesulfonate monooxygenase SsuD/methylene tetrahydromethanopterin reductase-like flavin-dependent oxidoreductase (luciferase family)